MRWRWGFVTGLLACALAQPVIASTCTRDTGPDGLRPAVWTEPDRAAKALTQAGFGELAFDTRRGTRLKVRTYRPQAFDSRTGRVWFVMHGAQRDAGRYIRLAASVAERYRVLAIAVEFSRADYPSGEDYTLGVVTRGRADARALAQQRWRAPVDYEHNEIERVFDGVRNSLGGSQRGYYLFGHSAGAQFTHRLLTFVPCARVQAAVAANAGWYTLPDPDGSPYPFPYSLRNTPHAGSNARTALSAPLILLLGTQDIHGAQEDPNVRETPGSMAQGPNRLMRGEHYFQAGQALARRRGLAFGWQLHRVPGARHDAAEMISPAGRLLFEAAMPTSVQ